MKELLEKNNITLYSTENEEKSSVCERWNRTIKTKMWKQFLSKVIPNISTYYQRYWSSTITPNTVPLK